MDMMDGQQATGAAAARTARGTLVVRLSPSLFSTVVLDGTDGGGGAVARRFVPDPAVSLVANLKTAVVPCPCPQDGWGTIDLVSCDGRVTFVPAGCFDRRTVAAMFDACFTLAGDEVVEVQELPSAGCVALYAFNRFARRGMEAMATEVRTFNAYALLLDSMMAEASAQDGRVMRVHVSGETMGVFVADGGRLVFANVFDCTEDNLRLFYLLHVLRAVGFSQLDDTIYISKEDGGASQLDRLAKLYVDDVRQMPVARPPFAVDGDGGCLTHDMAALLSSHRTN